MAEDSSGVFAEVAVVGTEGGESVGIDVEFPGNLAADKNGDNDFRPGFEGAGEIARVCVDIVDDDSMAAGGCGATDSLIERDARVGRHGTLEGAEDEDVAAFLFQHVKADPIVFGELFVDKRDDGLHERFGGNGGIRERVEFGN